MTNNEVLKVEIIKKILKMKDNLVRFYVDKIKILKEVNLIEVDYLFSKDLQYQLTPEINQHHLYSKKVWELFR